MKTTEIIDPAENPSVDHHVRAFLKALNSSGGQPIETLSVAAARQVLIDAQADAGVTLPPADVEEKIIVQDGIDISLTIVRPVGLTEKTPVFMFFHGGGWILGDFQTHERFVRDLVVGSGFTCVFVNYTPSPEAKYPTAIHQAYAATKWVAAHGDQINVDGSRLAVVGNSVGGNMSAVVALIAQERGEPAIASQVLFWPVTDANFDTDSYHEFAEGYFLTRSMMKWFWDAYTTDENLRRSIYASPLQASIDQLKGLPPALVQIAGNDVLRDEGATYARKLDEAGVDVIAVRYEGLIHDYGLLNALSEIPAVRAAIQQAVDELKLRLQ
ncbi:alpha/beta hydrolase [Cerasicoccus frondis]|uniref:alpha/beta hydrolase n=1 Tax=Cerasicoccus frondis TaxID=490090 RepID=UPI0028528F56|nr:alpha/beta hydrolase [Cerasicoccus frondis]